MKNINADRGGILPTSELEVMNTIWKARKALDRPVITADVFRFGSDKLRSLKETTVLTMIRRLTAKGFLKVEKKEKFNIYLPLMDDREYRERAYLDFVENVMQGDRMDLAEIVTADMNPQERDALLHFLTDQIRNNGAEE